MTTKCAVGRKIGREDDLGGLDWKSPCPRPIGPDGLLVPDLGAFELCVPHAAALLPHMARTRDERLRRERAN